MVNFIILLILHLLGDFYFQTSKIAKCKNAKLDELCADCQKCKEKSVLNFKYVFIHIMLYIIPFATMFFMTSWTNAIIIIVSVAVSHSIIDILSCFSNKKFKQTLVFIIDQFLHISILFILYKLISLDHLFDNYYSVIKGIFTVLLLMVPSSVFINKLFEDTYYEVSDKGIFDIGSVIGILERFLVIIFAYFQNFAAIAIIVTVKTWARTNDLKQTDFRNKYLMGTLASLMCALGSYLIIRFI